MQFRDAYLSDLHECSLRSKNEKDDTAQHVTHSIYQTCRKYNVYTQDRRTWYIVEYIVLSRHVVCFVDYSIVRNVRICTM
jgi:hypothetical protein